VSRVSLSCLMTALLFVLAPVAFAQEAPEKTPSEKNQSEKTQSEAAAGDSDIAGGRDISAKRDVKLVWSEMVQIRDKMMEIENERKDMRAVTLSPQEQALLVAYSKRLYDLTKELEVRTRPSLEGASLVRVRRALKTVHAALSTIRGLAAGPIHRELPEELRVLSISLKGLYASFADPEVLLGPEGLPAADDLKWQGHAGQS